MLVGLRCFKLSRGGFSGGECLDKDAFLVAQITHWDQYNLLEREANLYFEDAYIGRSVLNAKALKASMR